MALFAVPHALEAAAASTSGGLIRGRTSTTARSSLAGKSTPYRFDTHYPFRSISSAHWVVPKVLTTKQFDQWQDDVEVRFKAPVRNSASFTSLACVKSQNECIKAPTWIRRGHASLRAYLRNAHQKLREEEDWIDSYTPDFAVFEHAHVPAALVQHSFGPILARKNSCMSGGPQCTGATGMRVVEDLR